MGLSSVRYSALPQHDEEEMDTNLRSEHVMEYGMPEGTFDSAFTYATYNQTGKNETSKSFGPSPANRYTSAFSYSNQFNNDEDEVVPMNIIEMLIYGVSFVVAIITLPLSLLFSLKFVQPSEKLVIFRLGRAQKPRGAGATFVIPCIDTTHKVTTTVQAFNVPPLQVITQDRGLVELGATVFLQVMDPVAAVCGIQDSNTSTRNLANTMLYRHISKKRICELTNPNTRRIMVAAFKDELTTFTAQFGITIKEVEFSDPKVVKEGENMGMAAINSVVQSETGKQIWQVIEPHVNEFVKETTVRKKSLPEADLPEDLPLGIDVDHLVSAINMAIDEHLTRAVGKVFQVNCSGMEPLFIDLKHAPGSCQLGVTINPDVTFNTSQLVFFQLIKKTLSPIDAYMNGSLQIEGNIQDALSLKYLAERVSELL